MRQKLITIVLTLIAILAPILIMPTTYNRNYNLLKLITLLALGAILLILILTSYKTLKIDKKDILALIFLGLVTISTFLSSDIEKSIIGELARHEGWLMYAIYVCIYFCSKKCFKYKNNKIFLNIMFYTSLLIGILGIAQRHINYPKLYPIFNHDICATFGHSNFFGSYISIVLPIALSIFIIYGSKRSFILTLVMFFNMISSGTRSAWVAFCVIGLIGIVYLINQRNKEYFKRAIIVFVIFILIFIYLFNGFNILKINANSNSNTDTNITSKTEFKVNQIKEDLKELEEVGFTDKMGSYRIDIWRMTWKLVKIYPIIGCGPDNLKEAIFLNCSKEIAQYAKATNTIVDKAHNEYLHIAATLGIPALIIYLTFIGIILLSKTKLIFKNKFYFIMVLTIISYLVQAFFNISTIGVAPLFWMILGLSDNKELISEIEKEE